MDGNLDLAERFITSLEARDWDVWAGLLHPAVVYDLHALLKSAGIEPPYIIAGHSLGGIVARRFQARYPGDVAGMLLVDSSHEDQARQLGWRAGTWSSLERAARRQARILGARRFAASLGKVSVVDAASLARETVPEHTGAARAITLSSRQRRIAVRELLILPRLPRAQRPGLTV